MAGRSGDRADDDLATLRRVLRDQRPFAGLPAVARDELVRSARIERFGPAAVVLDGAADTDNELFVVVSGQVDLWHDASGADAPADQQLSAGAMFGSSALLPAGPNPSRAAAGKRATVAALPASVVEPMFASRSGARFLAERGAAGFGGPASASYTLVDDLIVTEPVVVAPTDQISDVARVMTDRDAPCAVLTLGSGRFGVITDAMLRKRVLVEGLPGSAPASEAMDTSIPTVTLGDSAAEALLLMLDRTADFLLVIDSGNELRGVITPRDFAVSPTAAGVSIDEQVRRASTADELQRRARRVPPMLLDLLNRGLSASKVIAVYSAILDTIVRRAIVLIFEQHPELSMDAFTWLSLGSNGRREAMPSSDVDSAVAFVDAVSDEDIIRYRAAFVQIDDVLANAGLLSDDHGASAERPAFARTNASWRAAAQEWLAAPEENQGAIMTSLLVDGRPIHGDPGLPAVTEVFGDLRRHPGTMRLLMQESLAYKAKLRSMRSLFHKRDTFDVKTQAMLPVVNLARWAALSVGSTTLSTTDRLRAAAGSEMLPDEQAHNLVEAFEVLQRLRLSYQLSQLERGERPSDLLTRNRMSPIDRSMAAQAVREIASVQRRMENVAAYLPADAWVSPKTS